MDLDLIGMLALVAFVGVMLLVPFGIMLGMALPRERPRATVSDSRQPSTRGRGRLEA